MHTWCPIILSLTMALTGTLAALSATVEDNIEWYDQQVYQNLQERDETYRTNATSGYLGIRSPDGSAGYYSFTETADGIAAIYEAAGREYYLERLIEYCKLIMAQGKDNNGDGYLDYFHWMYNRDRAEEYDKWDYEHSYAAACHCNIMRTLARCARIGRLGPHYGTHKTDIDEIVAFVEKHVIEKWEKGDQQTGIAGYLAAERFTINGVHSHLGSALVDMWLATGNDHYRRLAQSFAEQVKGAWVLYSNGSYAWSADGGIRVPVDYDGTDHNMQDISHGSRVIRFAIIAHRAGIVVDTTDMERLLATFNQNVWRGEDEKFAEFVNGADRNPDRYSTLTQWVALGAFDADTHQHMTAWTGGGRAPDKYHEDRIQYYGNLALNLKLQAGGYTLQPWQPEDAQ